MTDKAAPETHLTGDAPAAASAAGLADRRDLAFVAVERTRMPMIVTDCGAHGHAIILANRAFLEMSGYSADEVVGRNARFMQGAGTDPATLHKLSVAIAAEREITVELLNYRKDGSSFWNRLLISPIHDDDGKVQYFFASQQDVTEERRARELESAEHRLLREVDHRAKNALALVQGIVRLTRADDAGHYSRAVQGRVDALAQAHSLLSDTRWQPVGLRRLIAAEVDEFGGGRVRLVGPDVDIAAEQVQPLALLLHEMVANAAEHGSLSTAAGTLAIGWRVVGGSVEIAMRETGGPPPPDTRKPGLGLTMMDSITRRQLRGTMVFDWSPGGLTTELTLPLGDRADRAGEVLRAAE